MRLRPQHYHAAVLSEAISNLGRRLFHLTSRCQDVTIIDHTVELDGPHRRSDTILTRLRVYKLHKLHYTLIYITIIKSHLFKSPFAI